MSRPFLPKGPQNRSATEETRVRAPADETAQQRPGTEPPSGKAPEQRQVALSSTQVGTVDIEAFSRNLARLVEEGGRALAAYLKPREEGREDKELADEITEIVKTLSQVANIGSPTRSAPWNCRPVSAKPISTYGLPRLSGSPANRRRRSPLQRLAISVSAIRNGRKTSSSIF